MANEFNIKTQQSLLDYASIKENFPAATERGLDDYSAKGRDLARLLVVIPELIPLDGAGSPEGVVISNLSKQYIDTSANQLYFNPVAGVKTGWVAV